MNNGANYDMIEVVNNNKYSKLYNFPLSTKNHLLDNLAIPHYIYVCNKYSPNKNMSIIYNTNECFDDNKFNKLVDFAKTKIPKKSTIKKKSEKNNTTKKSKKSKGSTKSK